MFHAVSIPCTLMRGGTSRGPFFLRTDLPRSPEERDAILLSILGAGHELQVDGLGGGNPLTSKVAIVGPSTRPDADVDYLFAQVKVTERVVDTSPNCGNMLSAVGPFAIERGLVAATPGETVLRIHNVNTGKVIVSRVQTPDGHVTYDGEATIDGVPGTAAPIYLTFLDVAGAKTGRLLPSGNARDTFDGIEASCVDAAMPLVILRAEDFGKTGHEKPADLDADRPFMERLERIRREAGLAMGLGDVSGLVVPKPVLLGRGTAPGAIVARYFMPHACHKALAITGGVGIATACVTPGTVASAFVSALEPPCTLTIEHPSGKLDLHLDRAADGKTPDVSVLRTARRIFEGAAYASVEVPARAA